MKLVFTDDAVLLKGELPVLQIEGTLEFGDAQAALRYAEQNNIEIEHDSDYIGFMLGGFAVALSEGAGDDVDETRIIYALTHSTDDCWHDAVLALAELLKKAAEKM